MVLAGYVEYESLPLLAQWWLPNYMILQAAHWAGRDGGYYPVLEVEDRQGKRWMARDQDVAPLEGPLPPGSKLTLAPSDEAAAQGYHLLYLPKFDANNKALQDYLEQTVYHGSSQKDLALVPLYWGLGAWVVGLVVGGVLDGKRKRFRQTRQIIRGPELLTVKQFNRRHRKERAELGIGFYTSDRDLWDKLRRRPAPRLYVPFDREAESFLKVGDSGAGKTSLIKQILLEVWRRGDIAIVNDPARQYLPEFYDEARGDWVINALDERMPYWNPSDELQHPAEAESIAESLFPDDPSEKTFFIRGPREIFAHLLKMKATPEEIIWCLSREDEIVRLMEETMMQAVVHRSAHEQRAGVLAQLNLVASALKLLPRQDQAQRVWTATEWSRDPRGWLFFTTTNETRTATLPLVSLWLDLLVMRLITRGKGKRRVWFVLDELAMLQHLPQLHTAVTENRKSNNPVVLAFQARSQVEKRYGLDSKPLLSSPATKFFLRNSEPESAHWVSQAIGEVMVARLRESRSRSTARDEQGETISEQEEIRTEPLVMASEIAGLDDRHGYVKTRNLVVPIHFPIIELPTRTQGLLLRKVTEEFLKKPQIMRTAAAASSAPSAPKSPPASAPNPPPPPPRPAGDGKKGSTDSQESPPKRKKFGTQDFGD
jgi:hypothetical protein